MNLPIKLWWGKVVGWLTACHHPKDFRSWPRTQRLAGRRYRYQVCLACGAHLTYKGELR